MITKLFTKIIGSRNDRPVKALKKIVKQINELEPQFASLADADLQAKTVEFRERLEKGEELDSLLPEAFATVREASKRVFAMRHFDVQMMAGYRDWETDRKSTRLNSSHSAKSRMPSSA